MPTLEEWEQALVAPRRVTIESSPALVREIGQRQTQVAAERQQKGQQIQPFKPLSEVAEFAPQRDIQIIPAFLLHRLGVVTTPPVPNLADICSSWAHFRYLWAFEVPSPGNALHHLQLSAEARKIDFHQKALLSDQIGVGMAAVLMGSYLDAALAADISVAMDDPAWPITLQYDASPDYLFFSPTLARLFIVECKGTQSSRSQALDQLRRGTEQVPSLVFTDGRRPPSLVVATCLSFRKTIVLVLDPPGESDNDFDTVKRPERFSEREWRVRNDAEFSRATQLISDAKLLSFAGQEEAAAVKREGANVGRARAATYESRPPEIRENEFGQFAGLRQRVGVKDRVNIDIFQALDATVYKALVTDDRQRINEEVELFHRRALALSGNDQPVMTSHENGTLVVKSAGPDGTLLEIRIAEQ